MQRSTFRLSRPFQAMVYLSLSLLLVTGAGWMYAQSRLEDADWQTIPRQLMKTHGAAAMVALLILGALTPHVKRGWKADRNRITGAILIAVLAFLVVTGYALYYSGDEALRDWCSHWHAWIGLGLGVILPAHVIAGRWIIRTLHRQRHQEIGTRPPH